MSKFGRKIREPPVGYDYIEPTITALENEIRESKTLILHLIHTNSSIV